MDRPTTPFHPGEIEAQNRADVAQRADKAKGFIRDFMPQQHRDFFAEAPFLVVAGADAAGRPWVTILEGEDGAIGSHSDRSLELTGTLLPGDPLQPAFRPGAPIGILGIELASRRRNRVNGRLRRGGSGLVLDVDQSFGNCAQYIRERDWHRVALPRAGIGPRSARARLSLDQRRWIESADTFFIGSGHLSGQGRKNDGFDASHRGGRAGFVQVDSLGRLRFPDYAGNNFFNTIGNLLRDSRVALLFVDFPNGNLLHLTGRAEIIWNGDQSPDPGARREVLVTVDQVIERSAVLASRWRVPSRTGTQLEIRDKLRESDDVTSFYLAPPGGEDLVPGKPGQHLAVALDIPELPGRVRRTYSLSGPANGQVYRISVKREPDGIASRFLHDKMKPGDLIETRPPAGAFILPEGPAPLLLISAGVGVTPMLAMLHATIKDTPHRQVWFLHGTRNGDTHAFRKEVASLAARSDQVQKRVYYSAPLPEDLQRRWHDTHGRITPDDVIALAAGPEADYMICGPTGFTTCLIRGLERSGIALDRIHHETFGPTG